MSLSDFLLEVSRVLIGLGLAVFVGIPLAGLFGRMTRGEEESRSSSSSPSFGRARFVAAGGLLVGVLLDVQVVGSALAPRHVARAIVLFVLVASLVYSVMVVAPKARYYAERSLTFEESLRAPWHARRDSARARGSKIDFFGFLLALAALVLG